ncbi:MAG: hypothetical protein ACJ77V_07055 [Chloroflexota bacterium]
MQRIVRKLGTVIAAIAMSFALVPGVTAAPRSSGDITATTNGRESARAAADRFSGRGFRTDASSLRVVVAADGSEIVGPSTYSAADLANLAGGGSISVKALAGSGTTELAAAAPYWNLRGSNCFARYYKYGGNPQQRLGWMDTCYHIHKLTGETDGAWDYWDIHGFATVDATNSASYTDSAWIHVDRDGGPTFYWYDWSPRSDTSGNCRSVTLSVSAYGAGLSFGHDACEVWNLTKYAAAGELKEEWDGFTKGAREVALMSSIKVANGASSPIWGISWNAVMVCITDPCPGS